MTSTLDLELSKIEQRVKENIEHGWTATNARRKERLDERSKLRRIKRMKIKENRSKNGRCLYRVVVNYSDGHRYCDGLWVVESKKGYCKIHYERVELGIKPPKPVPPAPRPSNISCCTMF